MRILKNLYCRLTAIGGMYTGITNVSANQISSKNKFSGSSTFVHKLSLEAEKYSSLPHTIFAPDGRLYNIEKNARAASDPRDLSSSLVVALKFGKGKDAGVLILSTSHSCPLLVSSSHDGDASKINRNVTVSTDEHKDNSKDEQEQENDKKDDTDGSSEYSKPLWSHASSRDESSHHHTLHNKVTRPLSILPSNIIIGTGGTAADATAMHNKILQMALSLCKENDDMRSTHKIRGTILASMLAKKVANVMQLPTQSATSDRMLASEAIVIGEDSYRGRENGHGQSSIWRCDATGQFWDCHAAAVGRGAGSAEAEIMAQSRLQSQSQSQSSYGAQTKDGKDDELDDLVNAVSPKGVQEYLESLTFDDAIVLACKCIAKALNLQIMGTGVNIDGLFRRLGMQGVLVHCGKFSHDEVSRREYVHPEILRSGLQQVLDKKPIVDAK